MPNSKHKLATRKEWIKKRLSASKRADRKAGLTKKLGYDPGTSWKRLKQDKRYQPGGMKNNYRDERFQPGNPNDKFAAHKQPKTGGSHGKTVQARSRRQRIKKHVR
jgi:hypothetical protein